MLKKIFSALAVTTMSPAFAHDGLALDSFVHELLHRVGTETVIALGMLGVVACVAALVRVRARKNRSAESRGSALEIN
jgi:hypothetical protein